VLTQNTPNQQTVNKYLADRIGARKLVSRCYEIIGRGKTCNSIRELRDKVAQHYGKGPIQLTLYLPKREMQIAGEKRTAAEAKDEAATEAASGLQIN
jgi:hypothetical protein